MKPNIGQGDKGDTSLFDGNKISKDDYQVEAYGNVDELNSYIGLIRSSNKQNELDSVLEKIQEDLLAIGSNLASTNANQNLPEITEQKVKFIEESMMKFEKELPQLKHFILPTGTNTAALLHVARTVCRRTERSIVSLSKEKQLDQNLISYVNRLSDLFFTLARYVNYKEGKQEKEWISK